MKIRNWEALNKELNLWALMAIVVAIVVSAIGVLVFAPLATISQVV